ncbi:L-serine dehydratase, alpha chain [Paenibacillus konkukensis]|uniref:L-serine ammonia-lyase n=1 Tax=Paenibacillus konkukensis TaxID=2020716 RepID=A0ABY4RKH6_9BACL|nr:L-serine dehydratase, alpha chain [Paenibacillus konkukensis]
MNFRTLQELASLCQARGLGIGPLMLEEQAAESGRDARLEFAKMADYYAVMKDAVQRGLHEDTTSRSGLTGLDAQRVMAYRGMSDPALDADASLAMAYALAVSEVNASMGRIIATPTAGSCGIIPGVFVSCQQRFGWSDEHMT